jgi:hypothetical protein
MPEQVPKGFALTPSKYSSNRILIHFWYSYSDRQRWGQEGIKILKKIAYWCMQPKYLEAFCKFKGF